MKIYSDIEYNYLDFLQTQCAKVMRLKQELQYKLYYYQNYPRYAEAYQKEISRLDMEVCNKYNIFSQIIR